ncbi:phospho-sugar mutase [Vibrio gazogenes]|uniref:Phosphomannomutase n=1 Tax=Vibrio gazogenes DSM 21264 = NBRC 103151 TaxID=1123492 RepID=A0A1M4SKX7_VIBGA|nr:phospho-sugar mutase [Vibrio gazogenes]USP15894.1 phospho-sugar mutase [Vibrio gazogenes]SHE32845.1 phosphomannomutase [Vibrio gazogenes DSM 21264] [Vibrio gazogenes DSM 21264 = NBRC 103151]SJN59044.1 Phosphoglucomutase [Vibrio gazogenes]
MNEQFSRWLARDPDRTTKDELQILIDAGNQEELQDRFNGRLAFGTAGLRGKVGCGPNRMNRLVIQETATGLGNYLIQQVEQAKERGVIIGYDGRLDSRDFAYDTASVLAALGIKVYLTDQVAPTPVVAYGIRQLNTAAGVVVTASHNPPEYNGFKVYWENGAQIIPPHDQGIAQAIELASQQPLHTMCLTEAEAEQRLVWLSDDYYDAYRLAVHQHPLLQSGAQENSGNDIAIAYTAMHGVGAPYAEALLQEAGFTQVHSVAQQREPDGRFPTVKFPNPEEPGAMDLVIGLAEQVGADLACANDPDADRFAVAARQASGEFRMLTGDQVGSLLGDYLLEKGHTQQALVGNTIVSSSLLEKIAEHYGATYFKTLTGFKWLTNVAMQQQREDLPFLFAYEEALGYTIGTQVWDKDGLSTLLAFVQMCTALKHDGQTVWDRLEAIYRRHGLYVTAQKSIALSPETPPIGDALRADPPQAIAGRQVMVTEDYKTSQRHLADGRTESIDLPVSDVLVYQLDGGARVIVRPSGTEPKLKCYYELVTDIAADEAFQDAQQRADEQLSMLIAEHQIHLQ